MTNVYVNTINPQKTPQTSPVPDMAQVQNSAGGYVFDIGPWGRLDRFLVLGSESNTYYASAEKLTHENVRCVQECIALDGQRTVDRIVAISEEGRAPKNDPAILALALCAKTGDATTRTAAYAVLDRVCRIGTHLFTFLAFVDAIGKGSNVAGNGIKRAVGRWYSSKTPRDLAYQVTKYGSRAIGGKTWTHRDALRLAHPQATLASPQQYLYPWITTGTFSPGSTYFPDDPDGGNPAQDNWAMAQAYIGAVEELKTAGPARVVELIGTFNLPREVVPTEMLQKAEVWEALLQHMPYEALLRNLATMTKVGLIAPNSDGLRTALGHLGNADKLRRSRVHPIAVLKAMMQYKQGHGRLSSATWTPVLPVVTALETAFYAAFGNVPVTNKRWGLFLDISGSMDGGNIGGMEGLTPRMASVALALATARVELMHVFGAFTSHSNHFSREGWGITQLDIRPTVSLDSAIAQVSRLPMGGTDCALPFTWALKNKIPVDIFVTLTDNESWAGDIHPFQALRSYREKMGIDAKAVAVGMTATNYSIFDDNPGCLNVVGFDTAVPSLMADFVGGAS